VTVTARLATKAQSIKEISMSPFNTTKPDNCCSAQWRRPYLAAWAAGALAVIAGYAASPSAVAQGPASPPGYGGVWFDDTGDGAVEIVPCADRLCGRIVWLKAPVDKSGRALNDANNTDARQRQRPICGLPVIGNLKRQSDGAWDEGWIYDPKQGKQFDVELKLRSAEALQVTGYIGVKFLSETFVWKRAPADLKRCT
jgi:uncharacterized protein (DUF2147 family)